MVSFETMSPMFWIAIFLIFFVVILFTLSQIGVSSKYFGNMSVLGLITSSILTLLGVRTLIK